MLAFIFTSASMLKDKINSFYVDEKVMWMKKSTTQVFPNSHPSKY